MPVLRVMLSLGRNRGSTRKLTPTLSFDSSTFAPTVAISDSPMRVKANDWPMLPVWPKSTLRAGRADPLLAHAVVDGGGDDVGLEQAVDRAEAEVGVAACAGD